VRVKLIAAVRIRPATASVELVVAARIPDVIDDEVVSAVDAILFPHSQPPRYADIERRSHVGFV